MVAPATWSAPASGGSLASSTSIGVVSYANGYWFALTRSFTASTAPVLRYATNPAGTWSTATLPAAPVGYTSVYAFDQNNGVISDGTTFAFLATYNNGSATKYRVVYATDPSGTWSSHEFDATDTYRATALWFANSTWVLVGTYSGASPQPAFIGTCSTANGTYSWNTSLATTGYDTTGAVSWTIRDVAFDGTTWVTIADPSTTTTDVGRYSTSLTSGWATPSGLTFTAGAAGRRLRTASNGYWMALDYATGDGKLLYTATPSGTWTSVDDSTIGFTQYLMCAEFGADYWVVVGGHLSGGYDQPDIAYTASTGAPSGTWTQATSGFTTPASTDVYVMSVAYGSGYFVALSTYLGELRWCNTSPPVGPRRRAIGTSYHLRQRQTPYIR